MKKLFKFGVYTFAGLFALIIVIALFSGGEEESVSTGTGNSTEAPAEVEGVKIVDVSAQTQTLHGLAINLGEVKITEDGVQIGLNINNTGASSVTFYPDQGSVVVGSLQMEANMFLGEGDVSGEIMAGVQKEGVVEFLVPDDKSLDVESIDELTFYFGNVFDEETIEATEATFNVPVK